MISTHTFFSMAATVFVQPLDLVKNRMQLSGEGGKQKQYRNTVHALSTILKNEGVQGIYTGLVIMIIYTEKAHRLVLCHPS